MKIAQHVEFSAKDLRAITKQITKSPMEGLFLLWQTILEVDDLSLLPEKAQPSDWSISWEQSKSIFAACPVEARAAFAAEWANIGPMVEEEIK